MADQDKEGQIDGTYKTAKSRFESGKIANQDSGSLYYKGSGYKKGQSGYYKGSGYTKGSYYSRAETVRVTSFIGESEYSDDEELDDDDSEYNLCYSYSALVVISMVLVFNTWSRNLLS